MKDVNATQGDTCAELDYRGGGARDGFYRDEAADWCSAKS